MGHAAVLPPGRRAADSRGKVCIAWAAFAGFCSLHRPAYSAAPPANSFVGAGRKPVSSQQGLQLASRRAPASGLRARARRGRHARQALPEIVVSVQTFLEQVPEYVETLGPLGKVYFFGIFVACECLSLPAVPLMLSSGYIFGLQLGCVIAILALATAASISFFLARTVLRPQLMTIAAENETFQKINCAVEAEGFKIILLLRLAPLLPFALSNYAYGLSNVGFFDFFFATLFGVSPGTCAAVYLASAARAAGSGEGSPWYVYAGGIALTGVLLKTVSDIAQKAINDSQVVDDECRMVDE